MMKVPNEIVMDADNLAKETGIPFQTILEVLCRAFLQTDPVEPAYKEATART